MVRTGTIKQKTVGGTTLLLKRFKDDFTDARYRYEIHTADGEVVEEDAGSSKEVAMDEFGLAVDIFTDNSNSETKSDPINDEFVGLDSGF